MKNLTISVLFSVLFSNFLSSQVNVGYAKAADLSEGRSFSSTNEAIDRFINCLESPLLGQIYLLRINQCFKNAGMQYGGRDQITITEAIKILKWVKSHPEDMSKYGIGVYQLSAGTYTFQTISYKDGKWVDGKQTVRQAHSGEYALEWWGAKVGSSWCLNLFPSVGEVQNKPAPAPTYEPAPNTETEHNDVSLGEVAEKSSNITVNNNITNNYYGTDEKTVIENEFPLYPGPLTDNHYKTVYWRCRYCGDVMHKNALLKHIRNHQQDDYSGRADYCEIPTYKLCGGCGTSILASLFFGHSQRCHGSNYGYGRNHRHNRNCRH